MEQLETMPKSLDIARVTQGTFPNAGPADAPGAWRRPLYDPIVPPTDLVKVIVRLESDEEAEHAWAKGGEPLGPAGRRGPSGAPKHPVGDRRAPLP